MKKLLSFLLAGCMLIGMSLLAACTGIELNLPEKLGGGSREICRHL